eukprot:SAG31_NODE_777_length_12167_cov_6.570683_2_plen_240_part_00
MDLTAYMQRIKPPLYDFVLPRLTPPLYKLPTNDEITTEVRERVYVGAVGCLINGTLADADNIPTPPLEMTRDDCLLLRRSILSGSRLVTNDDETLARHDELFPTAKVIASHVRDDLDLQRSGGMFASRLSATEQARANFLLNALSEKPPYAGKLSVQSVWGESFAPQRGWPKGARPELTVVLRPLGAGIDPDEAVQTSKLAVVNVHDGSVAWSEELFSFDLECEPTLMQVGAAGIFLCN